MLEISKSLEKASSLSYLLFAPMDWANSNYILLNNQIIQLKTMLSSLNQLPESISIVSEQLADKLSYTCQIYTALVQDLEDKCKNIEAIVRTLQCLKEGENQKLSKQNQQKYQIIQILTKKITKLQTMMNSTHQSSRTRTIHQHQQAISTPALQFYSSKSSVHNDLRLEEIKYRNKALRNRYFNRKRHDVCDTKINNRFSKTQMITPKNTTICNTKRDSFKNFNRSAIEHSNQKENISQKTNLNFKTYSSFRKKQKENSGIIRMNKKNSSKKGENVSQVLNSFLHNLRLT